MLALFGGCLARAVKALYDTARMQSNAILVFGASGAVLKSFLDVNRF